MTLHILISRYKEIFYFDSMTHFVNKKLKLNNNLETRVQILYFHFKLKIGMSVTEKDI